MKKLTILAMSAAVSVLLAPSASAETMWWTLTASCSCMADSANDFHLLLDTEDVDSITITNEPCPGCSDVEITVSGGGLEPVLVDFVWSSGYVTPGEGLELVFCTTSDVHHAEGHWTISGEFATFSDVSYELMPEPELPSMTGYGLVALVILAAVSGLWLLRRKTSEEPAES